MIQENTPRPGTAVPDNTPSPVSTSDEAIRRLLREQFGHDEFRFGQDEIIGQLLRGRDVLAILPTGAGKSLIFQLAAQLLPGLTLVVSPLIALMKDQAEAARESGLEVEIIHSGRTHSEASEALAHATSRETRLLYVTPERLQSAEFLGKLPRVSLLAIDEAHCISEWGNDFRPSYLDLGPIAVQLGRPVLLALTATATPWVRQDIADRLGMRNPFTMVRSVDRPNLFYEVRRILTEVEHFSALRRVLFEEPAGYPTELAAQLREAMSGSGIIYTATTRAAREIAMWLRSLGIAADYYHGQRKKADRDRVQEGFMSGAIRIIAATNAFGMGVDKPDVRFVIHRNIPASVEAYYQEAGRAGRDGQFARCTLIYRQQDLGRAAFLSASTHVRREDLQALAMALAGPSKIARPKLEEASGLGKSRFTLALDLLLRAGIVELRGSTIHLKAPGFDPETVPMEPEERRHSYEKSRLEMMRGFAELRDCRRRFVLNYFGQDPGAGHCRMCDNDLLEQGIHVVPQSGDEADKAPEDDLLSDFSALSRDEYEPLDETGIFAMGDAVIHNSFGRGTVERVTPETVTVLFEESGYKTLATGVVETTGLLRRA